MASKVAAGKAYVSLSLNDQLSRGLDNASKKLKNFGAGVANIGGAVGAVGASIVGAFAGTVKIFSDVGDELDKMSKRTGIAVEVLSELKYVASQTGSDFGSVENAVRKMQRSIYDASKGLSTQTQAFDDLGVTMEDLEGKTPDEQLKVFAQGLSYVQDSTKKAALAMTVFGRTGTNLLPMFEEGASGIENLQRKAKKLGLTISKEDTDAAAKLTDAFDSLYKVIAQITFQIGAAVSGPFTAFADKFTEVTVGILRWIKKNKDLIKSILYIGVIITAVGAAISAIGLSIVGLGLAFSIASVAVTAIGAAFLALVSPIGLATVAIASIGTYILTSTEVGAQALDWLGEKLDSLLAKFEVLSKGIGDALTGGDLALAAKVLWAGINVEFQKGSAAINAIWEAIYLGAGGVWDDITYSALSAFDLIITGVKNLGVFFSSVFASVGKLINRVISNIVTFGLQLNTIATLFKKIAKAAYELNILDDKDIVAVDKAINSIQDTLTPDTETSDAFYNEIIESEDEKRKKLAEDFAKRQEQRIKDRDNSTINRTKAFSKDIEAAELAKAAAKKDYDTALAKAKIVGDEARAPKPLALGSAVPDDNPVIAKTISSSLGTFSGASLGRTFGSTKANDETAKNTRQLVEDTKETNKILKQNTGLAFG